MKAGMEEFPLIAVRNTHKTGPLVHGEADDACREEERDHNDNDYMEGMRKQAASGPQGADDWPTGNDPCRYWDRNEKEGDYLTGDVRLFRVWTVEQTLQGHPTKGIHPRQYYGRQDKDNTDYQG
jgi:hypothetical protein